MANAAHNAVVYASGASTAFSQQATTKLTANTRYQVTLAAARRVDPAVDVVVEVDADGGGAGGYVTADPSTYVFDYISGIVTFAADQGASALVRVSGANVAVHRIAEARECSLSLTSELVETTSFDSAGYKTRKQTYQDFSAEMRGFSLATADIDLGAGVVTLDAKYVAGSAFLLEVERPGGAPAFRAWVRIEGLDHSLAAGSVVEAGVKLVGAALKGNNQTEFAAWGYVS